MFFKTIALFAAIMLMAIVSATTAASLNSPFDFEIDPVETLENNDMGLTVDQSESQHGLRQTRAACDLLTFLPVPGDSMCAASCIAARRGFKGGFCTKRKVCRCRF